MKSKIVIVGGVAGGATVAARARRSSDIVKLSGLLLQTPEGFDARYGVCVLVETEAIEIDRLGGRASAPIWPSAFSSSMASPTSPT